ncbi:hypothetical protein HR060_16380 [Catenovulum sp. SM1970]|nr:hypothetical protein [Marinifaba aquimaris]NTS78427.1 hypothetical protein [Marinifaba aquimaris]
MNKASPGTKLSTVAFIVLVMAVSALFNTANADLEAQVVVHQDDAKSK